MQGMFEKAVDASLKGKNRLLNVWCHDMAERMKLRRKGIAKADGMSDDYDVGTYPSPESVAIKQGIGVAGVLALCVLSGGLVAGGMAAASMLMNESEPESIHTDSVREFDYKIGPIEIVPPE